MGKEKMDRPITVRVIYYRRGWHQEQVVFTVNSSSNKKELKDAIALEIAEIVGLPSGGITIYWKNAEHRYVKMEEHEFDFHDEIYFVMHVLPTSLIERNEICGSEKSKQVETDPLGTDKIVSSVSTQTLENINDTQNAYNAGDFVVHYGVTCDNCLMCPMVGFRYKCLVCVNYDLCENCEMKHYHSEHLMVRMPNDNCRDLVVSLLSDNRRRSGHRRHGSYQNTIWQMRNGNDIGLGAAINATGGGAGSSLNSTEFNEHHCARKHSSTGGQEKDTKDICKGRKDLRHFGNRKVLRRCQRTGLWTQFYDVMQKLGDNGLSAPTPSVSVSDEATTTTTTEVGSLHQPPNNGNANADKKDANANKKDGYDGRELNEKSGNDKVSSKQKIKNDALKVAQDAIGVAVNQIYSATKAAELATQFMNDTITDGTLSTIHLNGNDSKHKENQEQPQTSSHANGNELNASTSVNHNGCDQSDGINTDTHTNNIINTEVATSNNDEIDNTISAAGDAAISVYQAFCQIMKVSAKMTGMAVNFLEAVGNGQETPTAATTSTSFSVTNNQDDKNNNNENVNNASVETNLITNKQSLENENGSSQQVLDTLNRILDPFNDVKVGSIVDNVITNIEAKVNNDTTDTKKATDIVTVEDCSDDDDDDIECITANSANAMNSSDVESVSESFIKLELDIKEQTDNLEIKKEQKQIDDPLTINEAIDMAVSDNFNINNNRTSDEQKEGQHSPINNNENRRYESTQFYHHDDRINNAVAAMSRMGFSNENDYLVHLLESVNGNISYALDIIAASQH